VPAAERDHTAFVLAPAKAPAAAATPNWGAGTVFVDPGFNSGSFKGYQTTGQVTAPHDAHGDPIAQLGKDNSSISQEMTLNAGTYQGSAWVQVKDGKTRQVSVSASGEGVSATMIWAPPATSRSPSPLRTLKISPKVGAPSLRATPAKSPTRVRYWPPSTDPTPKRAAPYRTVPRRPPTTPSPDTGP